MANNSNNITTDSPISRRIVHAFLQFLNNVELAPDVDVEGIEVVRECLSEAFKLNSSSVDDHSNSDSLVEIFNSLEPNKQCGTSKSDVGQQPDWVDASSSFSSQNAADPTSHSKASKSLDEDWTQSPHPLGISEDDLCGQFFAALEKIQFFRTNCDGSDDTVQLEKASRLFSDALKEMERSGCPEFDMKNLAESLKSLGNKAMQSKQYLDAIELYNCAIALCESNAVYYCNRAAAYTQIHKYTEAIQDCLISVEIDPNYSKAYSRLGLAYYAQGNYRDAIEKGFQKALLLDPNNESVKENIKVAEQKLIEQQHHPGHGQSSRSSQGFPNQSAQGSRSHAAPPPFTSMSINANDLASMFMNIAANAVNAHQGEHSEERQGQDRNTSGTDEPEIRFGGNVNVNLEQMPEQLTGAFRSVMEMFSGSGHHGQPQDHPNDRTSPS